MAGLNGLHRYFTSGTANSDTATQPSGSLVLQSASGLTPVSTVNIAQALVNADTLAQKSKKRKKTKAGVQTYYITLSITLHWNAHYFTLAARSQG